MDRYILLRNNEQTGPHSYESLVKLGLNSHDLIWVEGKSASWRHALEMDEFKTFTSVTPTHQIDFDKPPMSRTRLLNDDILVKGLSETSVSIHRHLPDQDLMEFPTLARFFLSEYYDYRVDELTQSISGKDHSSGEDKRNGKPGVWISYPSNTARKNIVLIRGIKETGTTDNKDILPAELVSSSTINQAMPEGFLRVAERQTSAKLEMTSLEMPAPDLHPGQAVSKETIVLPLPTVSFPEKIAQVTKESTDVIHFPQTHFRKPYSTSLQKIAIAVGIASLLTVGGLIASSIFNPPYELKTLSSKKSKVNFQTDKADPPPEVQLVTEKNLVITAQQTAAFDSARLESAAQVTADSLLAVQKRSGSLKKSKDKRIAPPPVVDFTEQPAPVTETVNTSEIEAASALRAEKEIAKKNISQLVQVQMEGYKTGFLGGIKEFDLVLKNNSNFPLDLVVVQLTYIQSNKKVYKTETIEFNEIAAQSHKTIEIPKSSRGVKVETLIKSIASEDMGLSYLR